MCNSSLGYTGRAFHSPTLTLTGEAQSLMAVPLLPALNAGNHVRWEDDSPRRKGGSFKIHT